MSLYDQNLPELLMKKKLQIFFFLGVLILKGNRVYLSPRVGCCLWGRTESDMTEAT